MSVDRRRLTADRRLPFAFGGHLFAPIAIYTIVLVAFFLRVYRLGDQNVWWDEGWSIWLSQKDFAWIAWRTAMDEHPPLHYWLLHFWNFVAGTNVFAGRFVSVAFGVLTIALIYRIGNLAKVLKPSQGWVVGMLAALFLATARFHIWWSQDIKNYTPSIFFAFVAVWFGIESWKLEVGNWRARPIWRPIIAYALCAALAMWTHYLAALVLIALNLYAVLVFVRAFYVSRFAHRAFPNLPFAIRNWLIANTLAAALFAPWMYLYLQNAASWSAAPVFDFVLFLQLVATVLPLGVTTNIENYTALTIGMTIIAGLGIFVNSQFAIRNSKPDRANTNSKLRITNHELLFALIVVIPPLLVYALSLTPVAFFAPKIQARYLLVLAPAYAMLLAFGVAFLSRFSRAFAIIAILFVLGANAFVLNDYYAERRLRDEYATLANTINAFARQGDLILLDTDQEWPTFLYYLRYPLDWLGVPNGKPMNASDADALVRRALNRNRAVWLVSNPDALVTDPQKLLQARLAHELPKQLERTIGDKRLVLHAPDTRDWVAIAPENFAPQYARVEKINDTLQLLGFDLPTREVNAGDTLRLVTYWRARLPAQVSVRVTGLVTTSLQMPSGEYLRYENDFAIPPNALGEFALMVNQLELARIHIEPRASATRVNNIAHPTNYRFGDSLHLAGYQLPITNYRAGDTMPITLFWRADQHIEKSYTAFVHLVGAQFNPKHSPSNPLWGQVDRVPSPPTNAWLPGEFVPDAYRIAIDADAPPGKYQIEIGLYDPATGARLPTDTGDAVVIAGIEITR
ncbi:MAG: glycosyltransferase family 39 protein [Chloroflexi bacterium]|nr:glycosyltransferase family 39 protein [Chloroflexota bacterium]